MTEQELGIRLAATLTVLVVVAVVVAVVALTSRTRSGVSRPGYPPMPRRAPGYPQLTGWQWGPHGWEYITQSPPSRLWPGTVVVHRPPQRRAPTPVPPIPTTAPRCTGGPVVLRPRRNLSGAGSTSMKHRISRRP